MSFHSPHLLWLLLGVVPVTGLYLWMRARRREATRRFGDPRLVAELVHGPGERWRAARAALVIAGLALLVVALAGPQYGTRTKLLHKRGIDVVVALDFSKSMLARDVKPNRIERAKAELSRLLSELDGDRVGVVAFAGDTIEFPMTVDTAALRLFLRDLGPNDLPVGGTAIGRALIAAQRLLDRSALPAADDDAAPKRDRAVILITDGEDHEGDPLKAAETLKESGIRVYAIGIGSRTGEPIPTYAEDGTWTGYQHDDDGNVVSSALTAENEETLTKVAKITGGSYTRAESGGVGIAAVRAALGELQQGQQEARRVTIHEPRYALVLLPAFLLLLLETLVPEAWLFDRRRRS